MYFVTYSERQAVVCEFKISLFYRASSRKAPQLQRNLFQNTKNQTKQTKKKPTQKFGLNLKAF